MIKKFFTVLAIVLVFAPSIFAQWTYEGAWPDTSLKNGTHGIAVDPDGKVWVSSYFQDSWVTPDNDTIPTSPIFVFNADGTPADFSPIYTVATGGGFVLDTLNGRCRGLGVDKDGNILYVQSGTSKMFKVDYKTGEGLARHDFGDELGSSPTAPAVAADGTIFVGPVVGGGTNKIEMYSNDFTLIGDAVVGPPNIGRTMEVSADGLTIYWMPFTAKKMFIYKRDNALSDFALVDSALIGMSIESSAWNPATGLLWVSNDARGDSTYGNLTWYGYDTATGAFADSFAMPVTGQPDEYPRGLDFSPDGNIAYVGLFGTAFNKIYKFVNTTVDVKEIGNKIPNNFELAQNYPNPFNPTTVINFSIPASSNVTLKVYDMLGREVASLLNETKAAGSYAVSFDASQLSSGTYIYTLTAGNFVSSKKMMLIK